MKEQLIEKYLYQNFTGETAKTYFRHIRDFLLSNKRAEKFKYKDVVEYLATIQKKYNNSPTCFVILCALKAYFEFLIEIGVRDDHPCKHLIINVKRKKGVVFSGLFTSEELELLYLKEARYKGLEERNRALISFMIYQALTLEELVRLEVKNIDIENAEVYIKSGKKNNSRTMPLNPRQVKMVMDYLKVRENLLKSNTDAFFVGMRGTPILKDSINGFIESLKPLFGDKNLNPTTIRQSVISNWINEKGIPIEDVQLLAGHRWLSSTEKYVNYNSDKELEMINKFHPLKLI